MNVCVLSAWFGGGGDWPHEPAAIPDQGPGVETLLVTDRAGLELDGWRTVCWRPELDPRMASKHVKSRPENWTSAEVVVWVDARRRPSPRFAGWCVGQLGDRLLAAPAHPQRRSLLAEAKTGMREPRDRFAGVDLVGQARCYLESGHPDNFGLWWTTIVVRRMPDTLVFGRRWLAAQQHSSTFDQLSFPHVARQTVGRPHTLPWVGPDAVCG